MKQLYSFILCLALMLLFSLDGFSQSNKSINSENQIEGLSIYPNPVTNGKVYITTKNSFVKRIDIYDVLGKKIHTTTLYNRELDVTDIKAGVYVIKIKEGKATTTRKLVIR